MKKVFIASMGHAPQVVTETLWALLNPHKLKDETSRRRKKFVPQTVHLLTTKSFNNRMFKTYEESETSISNKIFALFDQYNQKRPHLKIEKIKSNGVEISDIRDLYQNEAYGDRVSEIVREYKAGGNCQIHMSLAGGRKTMSSYDQVAMMYYGSREDEISHVLVDPQDLERCPDFWWPDQEMKLVRESFPGKNAPKEGLPTDSHVARLDLIFVPFPHLGFRMPEGIPIEARSLRKLREWVEFEREGDPIVLDKTDRSLTIGAQKIILDASEFTILAILMVAKKMAWPGVGPKEEGAGDNCAGWIRLDDLRYGLKKKNGHPVKRTTPAILLAQSLYWELGTDRKNAGNWVVDIGKNMIGTPEDPTASKRSKCKRVLKKKIEDPYFQVMLIPDSYRIRDGGIGECIGINLPADRIKLVGFSDHELNPPV